MPLQFMIEALNVYDSARALACQHISTLCRREIDPAYTANSSTAFLSSIQSEDNWKTHYLVAVTPSNTVLGWAYLSYSKADPHDPMYVSVEVTPSARQNGIGTALVQAVCKLCPSNWAATQFFAESYFPGTVNASTHPVTRWAEKNGWKLNEVDYTLRLPWPANKALLIQLMPQIPPDYEIQTYQNGVPPELQPSLGVIRGIMDADAPSGEIMFSSTPWSAEYYTNYVSNIRANHNDLVETVAIYAGEVVGFTSVEVPANSQRVMLVRGTGVLPNHRGKRIGLALKTQITLELLTQNLSHSAIETDTAINNPWMLNINRAVGFQDFCQLVGYIRQR